MSFASLAAVEARCATSELLVAWRATSLIEAVISSDAAATLSALSANCPAILESSPTAVTTPDIAWLISSARVLSNSAFLRISSADASNLTEAAETELLADPTSPMLPRRLPSSSLKSRAMSAISSRDSHADNL